MALQTVLLILATATLIAFGLILRTRRSWLTSFTIALPFYATGLLMPDSNAFIEALYAGYCLLVFLWLSRRMKSESEAYWYPSILAAISAIYLFICMFQGVNANLTPRQFDGVLLYLYCAQIAIALFSQGRMIGNAYGDDIGNFAKSVFSRLGFARKKQ